MATKRKLTDNAGNQFFPITHTQAVLDANGNSVEQRLQEQMDVINQKQLEVGAVPSDITPTEGSSHWVTSGGVYNAIKNLGGDHPDLTAGSAYDLVSTNEVEDTFLTKTADNTETVSLTSISGRLSKWNQLGMVQDYTVSKAKNTSGSDKYTKVVTVIKNAGGRFAYSNGGHKVYICLDYTINSGNSCNGSYLYFYQMATGYGPHILSEANLKQSEGSYRKEQICNLRKSSSASEQTGDISLYAYHKNNDAIKVTINNFMAIDLTAIFGSGNEPSVSTFKQWMKKNIGNGIWYAQNLGSLIPVATDSISYGNNVLPIPVTTLTSEGSVVFPNGMAQVGSVYDEIRGDKAYKRTDRRAYSSGDDDDTSVITDGTYTWYQLEDEEEFTLDLFSLPMSLDLSEGDIIEIQGISGTEPTTTAPTISFVKTLNAAKAIQELGENYVGATELQSFTSEEKSIARGNIDAASSAVENSVSILESAVDYLESKSIAKKKLVLKTVADSTSPSSYSGTLMYSSDAVRIVGSTTATTNTETYMERLEDIGLVAGDIIEVKATATRNAVLCFGISWGGGVSPAYDTSIVTLPEGETLHTVSANSTAQFTVPDGAVYLFVLKVGKYNGVLEDVAPDIFFIMGFKDYIETHPDDGSILSFHPDNEMLPRFMAAQKKVRHNAVFSSPSILFGHISDCHGANTNSTTGTSAKTWKRFIEFCNHWKTKGYISDLLDTGDIVEDYMINKRSNVNNTAQTSIGWRVNAEDVLTVVGNHDTASRTNSPAYNWLDNIGILSYNKYLAPNIGNWNVMQPTGAAENGWCFYYKDYTTPQGYNTSGDDSNQSTMTLRVIFVDVMGWGYTHDRNNNLIPDNTQSEWVSARLVEAANAGYRVAIAAHYMPIQKKRIECSYTSLVASESLAASPTYNSKSVELGLLVAKFQRGTLPGIISNTYGTFLGYITGHRHYDAISKAGGIWDFTSNTAASAMIDGHECVDFDDERYPQIEFSTGAGYVQLKELADYYRMEGTINQDNFQIIAFQMYNKYVRLIKIGCFIDQYMRKKDVEDIYCGAINEFDPSKTDYTTGLVTKDGIIYRLLKPVVVDGHTSWELSDKVRASRVISEYVTR